MPRQRVVKTSFNAGEFSPRVYGRIDIDKYANGCKTMKNFVSMPHGGATRRPGTQYIAETKTSTSRSRLIPFTYSTEQAYVIEVGDLYARFYKDGGQVLTVDTDTMLLLHCNGTEASTAFTDDGTTEHTVTANGNARIRTNAPKFGTGALWVSGSNDYLSIPDHADWDILSETNFTIDLWVKFTSLTGARYIMTQWESGTDFWALRWVTGTGLQFVLHTGGSETIACTDSDVPTANEWMHIAVCKVGNEYGLYVNGEQKAHTSDADTDTFAGEIRIGIDGNDASDFSGYMDEIRIYHGNPFTAAPVVGLTDTIIVPTSPYPYGDGTGTAYELATSYTTDEVLQLKWVQSADTLYIVSPDRTPKKLTRTDHDAWDLDNIGGLGWTGSGWDSTHWPPFLDINATTITLDAGATTGTGIALVASAALFDATHEGAYFAMHSGYVKVTTVTNSTNAVVTVINDLTAHTATADWYESAWSDYRGWPTCVTFYEDRLCFSGTSSNPDRIEMSQTGEYENFKRGELDAGDTAAASDGLAITLSSREVNAVRWMASTRKLLVGTSGAEWWIDGKDSSSAIDATELVRARNDSSYGSSSVAPVFIGNTVIFNQRLNKVVRAYSYDWETDQYSGRDITILAEHLTNFGYITEMAWQQTPHQIVWVIRSDGVLLGFTYMREQQVEGWHWHTAGGTDAEFESIACIEGENEDELWCIVKRTIDGSTVRYIERMAPLVQIGTGEGGSSDWALSDAFFVDSGLTYRGTAATIISGLDHLEGETVVALADGAVETDLTVSSGAITLDTAASVVHIGLNYNSDLESLWPVVQDEQGIAMGVAQRIAQLNLLLYKSSGGSYGPDSSNLVAIDYNDGDWDEGSSGTYYSGKTAELSVDGGYEGDPTPFIRQNEPLPLTVLAMIMEVEV